MATCSKYVVSFSDIDGDMNDLITFLSRNNRRRHSHWGDNNDNNNKIDSKHFTEDFYEMKTESYPF